MQASTERIYHMPPFRYCIIFVCFLGVTIDAQENSQLSLISKGFSLQSGRRTQEDRFIIETFNHHGENITVAAVFDGHGGQNVAETLKKRFVPVFKAQLPSEKISTENIRKTLDKTFQECHTLFEGTENLQRKYRLTGSTASITVTVGKICCFANLGDSRGFLKSLDQIFVTKDHKPTDETEKQFITKAGGVIYDGGISIDMNNRLAVSRAFGDCLLKYPLCLMNNTPDITFHTLYKNSYVILASDGFWDKISNEKVDILVQDALNLSDNAFFKKYPPPYHVPIPEVTIPLRYFDRKEMKVAKRLVYYAVRCCGSDDNTTVIFQQVGNKDKNYLKLLHKYRHLVGGCGLLLACMLGFYLGRYVALLM